MQYSEIDPNLLSPNPWNTNIVSPANEEKLETSIDRLDLVMPVIVRSLEDGTIEIVDGEHRVDVAKRKGLDVPILNLGEISDNKAKEIGLVANERYGADDSLKLAELLSELGDQDELSSFLPYSDAELTAIYSSTSIDLSELDLSDDENDPVFDESAGAPGKTIQTHQIMRQKVPIEDAEMVSEVLNRICKAQKFDSGDSMTNVGDALVYMAAGWLAKAKD